MRYRARVAVTVKLCAAATVIACDNGRQPATVSSNAAAEGSRIEWPDDAIAADTVQIDIESLDAAPVATVAADLILGSGRSGDRDAFGVVMGVAVDAKGRIYVLDPFGPYVRVFAGDGAHVRDIGRRGSGPGELSRPHGSMTLNATSGIAISRDSLFVLDQRLQVFDTAGRFLSASSADASFFSVSSVSATRSGLLLDRERAGVVGILSHAFVQHDARTGVESKGFTVRERLLTGTGPMHGPPFPLPTMPFAPAPDGRVLFAVGDSFRIDIRDADGTLVRSLSAQVPRVTVSGQDIEDRITTGITGAMTVGSISGDTADIRKRFEANVARHPRAKYRNAIGALIVSERGSILVRRDDTSPRPYLAFDPMQVAHWVMIDSAGAVMARVQLPAAFTPKVFAGCTLYGTSTENDASVVIRYNISYTGNC